MNRTRNPKKRKRSDGLGESWTASEPAEETAKTAIAPGGCEETVPAELTSATDVQSKPGGVPTAPQHPSRTLRSNEPQCAPAVNAALEPKKGRDVLTLQEQEFWTPFTDLAASDLLAAFDVPQWQPPRNKTSGVATVVLDKRSSLGVPITKTAFEQKLATLALADGSGELASSVRMVTRKQKPSTPVATGLSERAPVANRANPRAPASNSKQAVVMASPSADSTGSLGPGLEKIQEAATARSTPTPHITIGSVPTVAPQHTPSIKSSNNLQRAPAATATREPEKGREAREKALKERKEIHLASPSHPPRQNQTTAHSSAPLSEDLDDPIVFRARTFEKKKDNDIFFENAATRLRGTETVVAIVDHKKTVPAIATSTPEIQSKKGRKVLTEQEEEELVDEIQSSLTALEIGSVLGSSLNVPGWQAPKKTPGIATAVPDKGNLFGRKPKAPVFAFQAKPLPELKVAAIPSSFKIGPSKLQPPAKAGVTDVPEHLVFIPTLKSTLKPMPVPRTQSNVSSMPTAANFAFRAKPLPELKMVAIPSSLNTGISPHVARGATTRVTPTLTLGGQSYFVRLPTTSDFSFQGPSSYETRRVNAALAGARSNRISTYANSFRAALLPSPLDVEHCSTGSLASAMSKMAIGNQPGSEAPGVSIAEATSETKSIMSIVNGDSGKQSPPTPAPRVRRVTRKQKSVAPTPTHKDNAPAPSLIVVLSRPGGFPPASSRAKAPVKGDNPGKTLSAKAARSTFSRYLKNFRTRSSNLRTQSLASKPCLSPYENSGKIAYEK
jgi:hypothetical protein